MRALHINLRRHHEAYHETVIEMMGYVVVLFIHLGDKRKPTTPTTENRKTKDQGNKLQIKLFRRSNKTGMFGILV